MGRGGVGGGGGRRGKRVAEVEKRLQTDSEDHYENMPIQIY